MGLTIRTIRTIGLLVVGIAAMGATARDPHRKNRVNGYSDRPSDNLLGDPPEKGHKVIPDGAGGGERSTGRDRESRGRGTPDAFPESATRDFNPKEGILNSDRQTPGEDYSNRVPSQGHRQGQRADAKEVTSTMHEGLEVLSEDNRHKTVRHYSHRAPPKGHRRGQGDDAKEMPSTMPGGPEVPREDYRTLKPQDRHGKYEHVDILPEHHGPMANPTDTENKDHLYNTIYDRDHDSTSDTSYYRPGGYHRGLQPDPQIVEFQEKHRPNRGYVDKTDRNVPRYQQMRDESVHRGEFDKSKRQPSATDTRLRPYHGDDTSTSGRPIRNHARKGDNHRPDPPSEDEDGSMESDTAGQSPYQRGHVNIDDHYDIDQEQEAMNDEGDITQDPGEMNEDDIDKDSREMNDEGDINQDSDEMNDEDDINQDSEEMNDEDDINQDSGEMNNKKPVHGNPKRDDERFHSRDRRRHSKDDRPRNLGQSYISPEGRRAEGSAGPRPQGKLFHPRSPSQSNDRLRDQQEGRRKSPSPAGAEGYVPVRQYDRHRLVQSFREEAERRGQGSHIQPMREKEMQSEFDLTSGGFEYRDDDRRKDGVYDERDRGTSMFMRYREHRPRSRSGPYKHMDKTMYESNSQRSNHHHPRETVSTSHVRQRARETISTPHVRERAPPYTEAYSSAPYYHDQPRDRERHLLTDTQSEHQHTGMRVPPPRIYYPIPKHLSEADIVDFDPNRHIIPGFNKQLKPKALSTPYKHLNGTKRR